MLGHAIEYLADEYALECRSRQVRKQAPSGEVQAIEILKARSRDIYFACAVAPTMMDRMRTWARFVRA
jgi:hypothetical protein